MDASIWIKRTARHGRFALPDELRGKADFERLQTNRANLLICHRLSYFLRRTRHCVQNRYSTPAMNCCFHRFMDSVGKEIAACDRLFILCAISSRFPRA